MHNYETCLYALLALADYAGVGLSYLFDAELARS